MLVVTMMSWGCGGTAVPAPATASSQDDDNAASSASEATDDASTAPVEAGDSGKPLATTERPPAVEVAHTPDKPVLVVDADPPGVTRLSAAEETELKDKCGGLIKHLRKVSANDSSSRARLERIHGMLANPPSIPGVDVPRCAGLLQRSVIAYRAASIESEGINSIKRIMLGVSSALSAARPRMCPNAPATPADLSTLKGGPVTTDASGWQHDGWRCVRFEQSRGQRFQYELRTDSDKKTVEIIARGFPVDGQPAVELFWRGDASSGDLPLNSDVYRRRVTR